MMLSLCMQGMRNPCRTRRTGAPPGDPAASDPHVRRCSFGPPGEREERPAGPTDLSTWEVSGPGGNKPAPDRWTAQSHRCAHVTYPDQGAINLRQIAGQRSHSRRTWVFMPATPVLGRSSEIRAIDGLIAGVGERGAALVISGEPGIGKSVLLAGAARSARAQGMQVLTTTGVQSESHLPSAGLHQLLRPILDHVADLPGPQHDALLAAFGMVDA